MFLFGDDIGRMQSSFSGKEFNAGDFDVNVFLSGLVESCNYNQLLTDLQ